MPVRMAAGVAVPVRGAEAGEGGHEVDVLRRIGLGGEAVHLGGVADQAEAVAQPLHAGAGEKMEPSIA